MSRFINHLGLLRVAAFAIDWFVIAAWGGLIFVLVMTLSDGDPQEFSSPWLAQVVGFLVMTLPVALYFSVLESSRWRASLGKRLVGLCVGTSNGEPVNFRQAFLRNALKFTPWELGHLVAQQAYAAGEGGVPTWVHVPMVLSFALPAWWLVSLVLHGRTPYDAWASSRVESSSG